MDPNERASSFKRGSTPRRERLDSEQVQCSRSRDPTIHHSNISADEEGSRAFEEGRTQPEVLTRSDGDEEELAHWLRQDPTFELRPSLRCCESQRLEDRTRHISCNNIYDLKTS